MRYETFRHANYIAADEAAHHAIVKLLPARPQLIHDHDYYECFVVLEGEMIHHINGQRQRLAVHDLVFMRPSDRHALQAVRGTRTSIANIMLVPDLVSSVHARHTRTLRRSLFWTEGDMPETVRLGGPDLSTALRLFRDFGAWGRSPLEAEAFLLSLSAIIKQRQRAAAISDGTPVWLANAVAGMRHPEKLAEGVTALITLSGRSHEHVCRTTAAHFGCTPSALVNRMRMQYAAVLLSDTDWSLSDIAQRCGMETMSYFQARFSDYHGISPGRYRKRKRRDPAHAD